MIRITPHQAKVNSGGCVGRDMTKGVCSLSSVFWGMHFEVSEPASDGVICPNQSLFFDMMNPEIRGFVEALMVYPLLRPINGSLLSSPLQPLLSISTSPIPAISISHLEDLSELPTTHLFWISRRGHSLIPLTSPTGSHFSVLTSYLVFLYSIA